MKMQEPQPHGFSLGDHDEDEEELLRDSDQEPAEVEEQKQQQVSQKTGLQNILEAA